MPSAAKRGQRCGGIGPQPVGERDQPHRLAGDVERGGHAAAPLPGAAARRRGRCHCAAHALPGHFGDVVELGCTARPCAISAAASARDSGWRLCEASASATAAASVRQGGERRGIGRRLAQRQRAGLVEQRAVDLGQPLERAAVLDHDPGAHQRPAGDDLRHRHGQADARRGR